MSFKLPRFSEEKMIQIEQLISYATLLGLSGRDIVAIGGKMDRQRSSVERKANMEIVKSFKCLPIGGDSGSQSSLDERFKLKTINGAYNFKSADNWRTWQIVGLKSKKTIYYSTKSDEYELPRAAYGGYLTRSRYAVLLDIATGKLLLDF